MTPAQRQSFSKACEVSFSNSTFTLEVNGTPTVVFQAKWHGEADEVGHGWVGYHSSQLSTKGLYGTDLPLVIKVRIARQAEKVSYEAGQSSAEFHEGVKIVYLVELDASYQPSG